jgi:hypothetical protein
LILEKQLQFRSLLACLVVLSLTGATAQFARAESQKQASATTRLKGEAKKFQLNAPLLKGKALSDAYKRFHLDVAAFSQHAQVYNLHINESRKVLAGYQAGKADCQKMKKYYSDLSLNQFHLNINSSKNVKPPHSCLQI